MKKERNSIKLIALDMDGTLLNQAGVLSRRNKAALEAAMEQGIHVVIATGRVFSALPRDVTAVSGIEYAITSNGANIVRLMDLKTIYSNLILRSSVEKLLDIIGDPTIMTEVFFDHDVFAEKHCLDNLEAFGITAQKSKNYTLSTRRPVESVLDLIKSNESQLENINLIFSDQEKRAAVWKRLERMEDVTVTSSMPFNLEIGGATTSKASAMLHLAKLLGIGAAEIMACGDSENDLAMLECAGLSVAMENAGRAVRERADFITKSNAEDGVAYAVEQFALNRSMTGR